MRTTGHERPGQLPLLVSNCARPRLVSVARGRGTARRHRLDRTSEDVACPVLVVRGPHDAICPPDRAATLAAAAPRRRAETLPAGGHVVLITHPDDLAARVAAFLSDVGAG